MIDVERESENDGLGMMSGETEDRMEEGRERDSRGRNRESS